jgi:hypothetical protein
MTADEFLEIIEKEGEFEEWVYEAKNNYKVSCFIQRNRMKAWCGYVRIEPDNKLYNRDYDFLYKEGIYLDVHGGITFTDMYDEHWVLGFDCSHSGDLVFYDVEMFERFSDGIYRDKKYVIKETNNLAEQISHFSKTINRMNNLSELFGDEQS